MQWRRGSGVVLVLLVAGAIGCLSSAPDGSGGRPARQSVRGEAGEDDRPSAAAVRDLGQDERRGGHTLSRHVGLTDADLRARLAREPGIAAASTYSDRAVAEQTVTAVLARHAARIEQWARRAGRKPNLALSVQSDGGRPLGRVLRRGDRNARACRDAVVVLRWDERRRDYYVLTSYPEYRR